MVLLSNVFHSEYDELSRQRWKKELPRHDGDVPGTPDRSTPIRFDRFPFWTIDFRKCTSEPEECKAWSRVCTEPNVPRLGTPLFSRKGDDDVNIDSSNFDVSDINPEKLRAVH